MIACNIAFWVLPLLLLAVVKWTLPHPAVRALIYRLMEGVYHKCVAGNSWVLDHLSGCQLDINDLDLDPKRSYLVVSNHVSWADILILHKIFNYRIPMLKTVVKHQLLYLPIIGLVVWGFEYPMMRRYSKDFLDKHPEKKGEDRERLRKSIRGFKETPTCLLNFAEGTRITPAKQHKDSGEYRYLLRPKSGGLSFMMEAVEGYVEDLVDVTIVYESATMNFWDFISGRNPKATIRLKHHPVLDIVTMGDNPQAPIHEKVRLWLSQIWHEKDEFISRHYG